MLWFYCFSNAYIFSAWSIVNFEQKKNIFNWCTATRHNISYLTPLFWTCSGSVLHPRRLGQPRHWKQPLYLQRHFVKHEGPIHIAIVPPLKKNFAPFFPFNALVVAIMARWLQQLEQGSVCRGNDQSAGHGSLFDVHSSGLSGTIVGLEGESSYWEACHRKHNGVAPSHVVDWRCSKCINFEA